MAPPLDLLLLSDVDLCEKLRREDPEQYLTLVRMHLSFVLDINAEDYDTAEPEKSKFRPLKWGLAPFTKSRKPAFKGVMEGAPLTQEGICQVYQLIEFLTRECNISQEGIFRRSGKLTRQQVLKNLLNQGVTLSLDDGRFSVHDCASVLKGFLADLPEPLLTDAHYQAHCQIADMCGSEANVKSDHPSPLLRALQLLLLLLPAENRTLLSDVLELLHLAASHEGTNKMSADNLATLFTPHLLCPRKLPPEELHVNSQVMSKVVSFMITKGQELFEVPPKLATDIRAYWADKEKQKQAGKSEDELEEAEAGAASTVFSFVDRQLTAEANSSNPTEAALANLYAHIQSLPESAHKKRLVKQFNKENGNGTPLHVKKHSNHGRSFGDSIKKHIFTKGLKRNKLSLQQNTSTDDALKQSPETTAPKAVAADNAESLVTPVRPLQAKRRVKICTSDEENQTHQQGLRETMMTPRSRKPVLVLSSSNLAQFGTWNENSQEQADSQSGNKSPTKAETSLTSTFRDYLLSRSVLTASPVSLSVNASPEKLSNSLLYCLDGNDPSSSTASSRTTLSNISESVSSISSSGSRKRSGDSLFADQSISMSSDSAKKSTLESSYSSTLGSSNCVRETSL